MAVKGYVLVSSRVSAGFGNTKSYLFGERGLRQFCRAQGIGRSNGFWLRFADGEITFAYRPCTGDRLSQARRLLLFPCSLYILIPAAHTVERKLPIIPPATYGHAVELRASRVLTACTIWFRVISGAPSFHRASCAMNPATRFTRSWHGGRVLTTRASGIRRAVDCVRGPIREIPAWAGS